MKILVVADLHYSLPQFDWLVATAPSYDAVIIAGDLLEINVHRSMWAPRSSSSSNISSACAMLTRVLCLLGQPRPRRRRAGRGKAGALDECRQEALDPRRWRYHWLGNALVSICAWWDGPATQEEIGAELDAAAEKRQGPWIWIYHAPPPNSPVSWSGERYFGDAALNGWIARHSPNIVFSGHVHEAPFARKGSWIDRIGGTWVFNAGKQIGPVPTTIAIDTEAMEAAWFSLEGAESVKLDLPLERPLVQLSALPDWMN